MLPLRSKGYYNDSMETKKRRIIWTFEPDRDVKSLMGKAIKRAGKKSKKSNPYHGLKTRFINEAVRLHLAGLRGKREGHI